MPVSSLETAVWDIAPREPNVDTKMYLEGFFSKLLKPPKINLVYPNNLVSILVNLYSLRILSRNVALDGRPLGKGGLTQFISGIDPEEWKIIRMAMEHGGSLDYLIDETPQTYSLLTDESDPSIAKVKKILTSDATRISKPTRDTQNGKFIPIDASIFKEKAEDEIEAADEWRRSLRRDVFYRQKSGKTMFSFYFHMVPYFPLVNMVSPSLHKLHDQYLDADDRQMLLDLCNLMRSDLGKNLSVGYNSLGSGASVRLLHFQVFFHHHGINYEIEDQIARIMQSYRCRTDINQPIHIQLAESKSLGEETYQDSIWIPFGDDINIALDNFMHYLEIFNTRAKSRNQKFSNLRYNFYMNNVGIMLMPKKNQSDRNYQQALREFRGSKGFTQSEYIGIIPLLGIAPDDASYQKMIRVFKAMNITYSTLYKDMNGKKLEVLRI